MAKVRSVYGNAKRGITKKKTTRQGNSKFTRTGSPGPCGGGKVYKKKYRGQGK